MWWLSAVFTGALAAEYLSADIGQRIGNSQIDALGSFVDHALHEG